MPHRSVERLLEQVERMVGHARGSALAAAAAELGISKEGAAVVYAVIVPWYDPFTDLESQFKEVRQESWEKAANDTAMTPRALAGDKHLCAWMREMRRGEFERAAERLRGQMWPAITFCVDVKTLRHALAECFALGKVEVDPDWIRLPDGSILMTFTGHQRDWWDVASTSMMKRVHDGIDAMPVS